MYTGDQPGRDAECGYVCYRLVARCLLVRYARYLVRHEKYIQDSPRGQMLIKWHIATAIRHGLGRFRVPQR